MTRAVLSADPTALLSQFGDDFTEADLIACGVARRDADGLLRPAAALTAPDCLLLPFRRVAGEPPFDLLTPAGCLSGALPAFAALEDFRFRAGTGDRQGLLLADTLPDVAILQGLGFAASLAIGFDRLSAEQLDQARRRLWLAAGSR